MDPTSLPDEVKELVRAQLEAGRFQSVDEVVCEATIARGMLDELDHQAFETSLLVLGSAGVEGGWLLSQVASQLGIVQLAAERVGVLGQIYDRLVHLHEAGRRAVVIVDDAHHLAGVEALSAVRALLNFEHEEQGLVTLVLVGLPELEETLRTDPALQQRVEIVVRVRPLSPASTEGYVAHRVREAGGDPGCFEPEAVGLGGFLTASIDQTVAPSPGQRI